ncbi:hypothetical protein PHYSODRAFT_472264 [Phytophthora sojae]|uniref:Glutathione S-transferase n=1 Tax=Phytophthora sojae (strain P6497) TaxID=1094619 RepID=G4YFY5_PHYSP|nr:hypothetical protein PHYSODRAFT_472264 [Phytophthora sojae]EGZ28034.1 hypothetical protein PHYSODRAFT_472264 [Phytophthora sojae]|eukprot:XP_009515309.1 hypothetical protein PHYSODRAFT_472264 [Phytophthora sojae]
MPAFPALKLSYFGFAGRAEAARLAFYIGGVPFEDKRLSHEQFPELKLSLPLGQVPVLEVDGQVMTQTYAILRYAGRLGGLYPVSTPFAALKVDEMLHALCEMGDQIIPSFQEQDAEKRKAMREELATVTLPRYAALVEARLQKLQELPMFRSDAVFVHEISIYTWMNAIKRGVLDHIPTTLFDDYKLHNAVFNKIANHPKVKEWYSLPHDTSKLKLMYFPLQGRAEPIRLAFFIGGVEFEDKRLSFDEFEKVKSELPFNQLPVLEVDGEAISQSLAILRYAGNLTGLYPTVDPLVASRVDEIFVLIDEMYNSPAWRETVSERDQEKLKKLREGLSKGIIPKTLDFLEKRVAAFKGPYATGKVLTVADLAIYAVILPLKTGRPGTPVDIADSYEHLLQVYDQVKAHPKVAEWNAAHA